MKGKREREKGRKYQGKEKSREEGEGRREKEEEGDWRKGRERRKGGRAREGDIENERKQGGF